MPLVKVEKAVAFVDMTTHQPGCRTVTKRQHAELAGNVQWWATTAPALRAVLPSLFSMSATDRPGWVSPVGDDATKARKWLEYDEARALLRYLVKLGEKDRSLFRTSITSLLDPYDLSRLSVGPKWVYIGSDSNGFEAGGGGGVMSGIEFDQGEWTFGLAEDYGAALRAHCGDADDDLIIAVTELLIVIVMAAQYGHRWTGCVVCALIDNDNAKCWLRTRVADNRYVRYLLQILAVLEFKFKLWVISYYVNTSWPTTLVATSKWIAATVSNCCKRR